MGVSLAGVHFKGRVFGMWFSVLFSPGNVSRGVIP